MDTLKILEIACFVSIALGDVILMFPKRWALHLFNIGNFCGAIIYYSTELYYLLALVMFLTITNTVAIFTWRKKNIG